MAALGTVTNEIRDNSTPHRAADYTVEVRKTIPDYEHLVLSVVDTAITHVPSPRRWLDTGTGTGYVFELANRRVTHCHFVLADPSVPMLAEATRRVGSQKDVSLLCAATAMLQQLEHFDVITAVQCHHYGTHVERRASVRRCFELLNSGGVYVTSENVRAETANGHDALRRRWFDWLLSQGRTQEQAQAQLAREGTQYFPIRPTEYVALLQDVGFTDVELVFRNYGQAVFVGRKP
jgi:tRNA (cmo5U34)-methyltransferase